jgi:hypothetical protein
MASPPFDPYDSSAWTFQKRYVRCGKGNCSSCAYGDGHGPYWYGYVHRAGHVYTHYFGKDHPAAEEAARHRRAARESATPPPPRQAAATPAEDRWARPKKMDYSSACRIFGINSVAKGWSPTSRYRELMRQHHPDTGGSTRAAVAINLAYRFLLLWQKA